MGVLPPKPHFNLGHVLCSCLAWLWVEKPLRWVMYGNFFFFPKRQWKSYHETIKCIRLAVGREVAGMNSWVFSILCALNLRPGWVSTWTCHHCSLLNAATSSGHPPAHQSGRAGVCDSSPAAIPPGAVCHRNAEHHQPRRLLIPFSHLEGKVAKDWENTPVSW